MEAKLQKNIHLLAQLVSKDNVHFKVALFPFERFELNAASKDWILVAKRLKILPVMVDRKQTARPIMFHWNVRNLFYYRWHPRHLLTVPDFSYKNVQAGVPSPRRVTQRNISLVKLEFFARQNGNKITLKDSREYGLDRVSRWHYEYDWKTGFWILNEYHLASKEYPHIAAGIKEKEYERR